MYRVLFFIIIIVLSGACTSNTIYKKPDDLIAKKTMVNLLTDMYLANAASEIKNKKLEKNKPYMALVYKKYGVDSTQFQHSNLYYMSKMEEYEGIYEKVEKRLQKMLDTTLIAQKKKDSLRIASSHKKFMPKAIAKPLTEKKPVFLDKEQK